MLPIARLSVGLYSTAMTVRSMKEDDPLEDFTPREITLDGVAKRVYVGGSGPAVIVMTEMPGISPHVARCPLGPRRRVHGPHALAIRP